MSDKPIRRNQLPDDYYTRELTSAEIAEIQREIQNPDVVPPEANIPDLDIPGFVARSTTDETVDEDPPEEDND